MISQSFLTFLLQLNEIVPKHVTSSQITCNEKTSPKKTHVSKQLETKLLPESSLTYRKWLYSPPFLIESSTSAHTKSMTTLTKLFILFSDNRKLARNETYVAAARNSFMSASKSDNYHNIIFRKLTFFLHFWVVFPFSPLIILIQGKVEQLLVLPSQSRFICI